MGVILVAFGKKAYYEMAYNMALSLKVFNNALPITLIADNKAKAYLKNFIFPFDSIIEMDDKDFTTLGKIDPGKAKTRLYKYLPYQHNLYLDVDGIALKDVSPLLEELSAKEGYYYTDIVGSGYIDEVIDYAHWATNETTYEYFSIPKENKLITIQSSFAYFQKSPECEAFCDEVQSTYDAFDSANLKNKWGMTKPDELFYSGVASRLDIDCDGGKPVYFGHTARIVSATQLKEQYYILSIYGNGIGQKLTKPIYWQMYDNLMRSYCRNYSAENNIALGHIFKSSGIAAHKHANNRK